MRAWIRRLPGSSWSRPSPITGSVRWSGTSTRSANSMPNSPRPTPSPRWPSLLTTPRDPDGAGPVTAERPCPRRLCTAALVIAVVVTRVVYWLAEQYAETLLALAQRGGASGLVAAHVGLGA